MATRALQQVVCYLAWDTSANAYKTGDSANHSTSWVKDGTRSATTNATAEVDSTNCPGLYKVTMTSTETDCIEGVLCGKSNTANIVLIPTFVAFDYLNTSAPAAAGIPDVNVKNINNVSASSVTTVNANQGTTQPINFTGSAGSALVKGDAVDIAGAAVSTASAQIGVNVVNAGGTAWASGSLTSGVLASSANNAIADAMLDRDMSAGADSGSTTVRTVRQALRFLRNKWSISASTLTVCKEDDVTSSWTSTVTTDATASPVTANDPAGP